MTLIQRDELVFVPNIGFRLARGAMATPANVVVEHEGRTLTAGLTSDRDGAELIVTVTGLDATLDPGMSRRIDDPVRVTDDRGRVLEERPGRYAMNSHVYRVLDGPVMFRRVISLARITPDVRAIELVMDGFAGEWRVTIPVEPVSASGPRGVPSGAIEIHHGIAIVAPVVARTAELTAIELEAFFASKTDLSAAPGIERRIQGIGSLAQRRGLGADLIILRDSTGAHHLERPRPVEDHVGRGRRREVALFEPLPPEAVSASFEIPYVAVVEMSDERVLVPVPGQTEVTLAGCRAHVTTSRVSRSERSTDARPSPVPGLNGPCVRIVMTPADPGADRQLVYSGVVEGNTRGMNMSVGVKGPPVIEVPDPTGDTHVTLRAPVIRVRGPWRFDLPMPLPHSG